MISARTRLFVLLGDPVAHSLSPRLHNAANAAGVIAAARHVGMEDALIAEGLASFEPAEMRLAVRRMGGATVIGPRLIGLEKPVQILPWGSTVNDMVNIAAFAAHDADGD